MRSVWLALILPFIGSPRPAAALPAWRLVVTGQPPGLQLARLAPPRVSMPQLGEGEVTIAAGQFTEDESGRVIATGSVTLTQGEMRLSADKMTANRETGEVVAEGNVVFTQPGQTVRGARLVYNTDTRQVHAEAAQTVVNGVIVRARALEANPTRYIVTGASVTTCDLPRPHYQFTARTVVITPNDRIVARHVGIWLLGVRLLEVPRLTAHIGQGRGQGGESPFPRIGNNSRDGFYVQKVLPLIEDPTLYLDVDARLSVRRGLTGGFDAAAPAGRDLQWIGALKYRDEAPNQRTSFLEVDRLPEVGILWVSPPATPRARHRGRRTRRTPRSSSTETAEAAATSEPAPTFRLESEVGTDAEHQPGLLRPPEAGRWYLRAQTTFGFFHQRAGLAVTGPALSTTHARLDFRTTASRAGLRVAGLPLPVIQLFLRQSWYDDDRAYSVFGMGARQEWRLDSHWSTRLQAFFHHTSGTTPFQFDQVEIRTELQPALTYHFGLTTLDWVGRWDVDRGQLFDQEIGVARVLHCLEPRLAYHTRRRQITLELRIVGLTFE